ncbi:hypothetical protein [Pseudescherichia sp.]|uniref:hypothetical protein n=1 Tax=Pseudescherichia sp. TaxID=2055881 RepID=UPI0028A16D05|nr:hypothetical protein [Pseudescherichia sp.]
MKIALTVVASALLAYALNAQASDTGTLSISGKVVDSGFTVMPDGQRVIQHSVSTQTVNLPGDDNRQIIITAWD